MSYILNTIHTYPFLSAGVGLTIIALALWALYRSSKKSTAPIAITAYYSEEEIASAAALIEERETANPDDIVTHDEIEAHVESRRAERRKALSEKLVVSKYKVQLDQAPPASLKLQPDEPVISSVPAVSGVREASNVSGTRERVNPDANATPDASVEKKTAQN